MCRHYDRVTCSLMLCEWLLYCNMCRNCDTVMCSPMLCEWLLYCSCVVTVIQLYIAQCIRVGYYIVHVS